VFGQHRRAAAPGPAAEAGDDEKGVDLARDHPVDRTLDLLEILTGTLLAEFGLGPRSVSLHHRLPDEDPVLVRHVVEPHQIRLRGVDGDGVADDPGPPARVVLEKPVQDLSAGLPEADHCEFHISPCRNSVPGEG